MRLALLCCFCLLSGVFSKPMEALSKYNIVTIHGAMPSDYGYDCDEPSEVGEAAEKLSEISIIVNSVVNRPDLSDKLFLINQQ